MLHVTTETAYRWIRSGKLKAHKLSRKVILVSKSDLMSFVEQSSPEETARVPSEKGTGPCC